MLTAGAMVGGLILFGTVMFMIGRSVGGRLFWNELLEDRRAGHWALEKLGEAHRAKVEIVELP